MDLVKVEGGWLAPSAAASYNRARAAGCPAGITSSYRSAAQQAALRAKYLADPVNNAYAKPVGQSKHEKGLALDLPYRSPLDAESWMRAHPEHGWRFTDPREQWHCEYFWALDLMRNVPTIPIPAPAPVPPTPEEDIMATVDELDDLLTAHLHGLGKTPAYVLPGAKAYFRPIGDDHRVWLSAGKWDPSRFEVITLDPTDGFWGRQSDYFGEVYRKPGKEATWGVVGHPVTSVPVRVWLDAPTYAAMGSPVITNLDLANPFWALAPYGTIPEEGA